MSDLSMKVNNEKQTMNTGLLEIKQNKTRFMSNASLIQGLNSLLVCTAAHCVFDWYKQVYANKITFKTADNREYEIDEIFISDEWVNNGIVDYDTAFLTIKSSSEKMDKDNIIKPIFNNPSQKLDTLIPFIRKNLFGKKKMDKVYGVTFEDYIHNSSLLGIKDKMGVGSSGSPWILKKGCEYFQFSNTSLSFNSAKNIIWGPYWGKHIEDIYLATNKKSSKIKNVSTYKL
ncbi:hypothetical protein [Bacillus sp. JCM 19041]|uniref:hypothetical protein n=1 Tax=Bacillus sp. JCM 19041 TaxID=1460637 RepID=UPI000ABF0BDF